MATYKHGISRRGFLRGLAGVGLASAAASSPRLLRRALAAGTTSSAAYPTIFIQLRGGWDPVYHFCARTGLATRDVGTAGIRETASGIRWYEPTMPTMATHMEEATVIRNVRMSANINHHTGPVELWFGNGNSPTSREPWVNQLASAMLAKAPAAAPNVTTYWTRDYSASDRDTDYVAYHNPSVNPLGAAQRILDIGAFADSLDLSQGLPPLAEQQAVYAQVAKMDARLYDPCLQPTTVSQFEQASAQANDLLTRPVAALWPPDQTTRDLFGLDDTEMARTGFQNTPHLRPMAALAFQLARYQASHVISMVASDNNAYDSHGGSASASTRQQVVGARYFEVIAQLLSALKATPSPLDSSVSMFDTTHVVVASEMGRSPNAENGNGTFHWDSTHVACFGGRFKRGYAFGDLDERLDAIPADFTTGVMGQGQAPSWLNVVSTILKANCADPSTYSEAAPIDAVLAL